MCKIVCKILPEIISATRGPGGGIHAISYCSHRHGTGHGIGAYLKVHEGPILVRMNHESGKLQARMFFSDEPGFYKVRLRWSRS